MKPFDCLKNILLVGLSVSLFACKEEKADQLKHSAPPPENILIKKQAETEGKAIDAANDLLQKQQEMINQIDKQ